MKTASFQLVALEQEDAVSLNKLLSSNTEKFKKYFPITLSSNLTLEATERYILDKKAEFQAKSGFTFAIKDNEDQNIIGLIIIKKLNWETKQAEFAYCIGSEKAGKGWMTKAVNEISNYAFNDLKLKTLQIIAHKTNLASVKVAENCGFVWKRTLPNEFTPTNELPLDMELYELTNER
jgi:ribosomal-protein-alanine N-acetyltransferase